MNRARKHKLKNYVLGRWLVLIGALGALIAFVFWTVSLQDLQNWFAQYGLQLSAVMLIVTALLVVELPGRRQTRLAMQDASKEQGLEPPEAKDKAVFAAMSAQAAELEGLSNLRAVLRADFGWRWRYKLPWLMLNGDNAAIGRLLPNLGNKGGRSATMPCCCGADRVPTANPTPRGSSTYANYVAVDPLTRSCS
jgi:type VI secretion system protein ImpL